MASPTTLHVGRPGGKGDGIGGRGWVWGDGGWAPGGGGGHPPPSVVGHSNTSLALGPLRPPLA